jgi:hypothetical protein
MHCRVVFAGKKNPNLIRALVMTMKGVELECLCKQGTLLPNPNQFPNPNPNPNPNLNPNLN